jgi:hypothetical protein
MSQPRPHRSLYPRVATGVAVIGAGVIAVTPVAAPRGDTHTPDIQLAAGDEQMVLDLVRHGESEANANQILSTAPPGPGLTENGQDQADDVGSAIFDKYGASIDGVYASELLRTQETAAPLAALFGLDVHDLSGLNEVPAGFLEGHDQTEITGLLYLLPAIEWIFGNQLFPVLGASEGGLGFNGVTFDDEFSSAVQTIYDAGGALSDGELHDVAFSSDAAIAAWTLMNVENPDFELVFKQLAETHGLLPNTGQVVIEGDPTDGWTLVSWNGEDVPQTPDLLTGLFVDFRDLITAPQTALWHVVEALQGGDPDDISTAFQTGFSDVSAALTQFPEDVIDTFTAAAEPI